MRSHKHAYHRMANTMLLLRKYESVVDYVFDSEKKHHLHHRENAPISCSIVISRCSAPVDRGAAC